MTEAGDVEIGSPTKISLTAPEINATAASGDIQNVTTGATKSSNAADNAVNAALYYMRNFVTGGLD